MTESTSVTQSHLQRVLLLGLGMSIVLLLSAMLVAVRTVRQLDRDTESFTSRQSLTKAAIDDIEEQQSELNAAWLRLARKSDIVKREELLSQLAQSRSQMSSALELAYEQTELLRESIFQQGHGLVKWTVWLFLVCVVLAIASAFWVVRASTGLFRRLASQAAQLAQLQYQFLESQENVARRFSHELHDELGQALTAIKANLSALRGQSVEDSRVLDCMRLVDGAIGDVREMSQLLRPTTLDDFGLDAALRALCEKFGQRTGIDVKFKSNCEQQRLRDEIETHLFRIAQEALTNVARHSQASEVTVSLQSTGGNIRLQIADNGRGFTEVSRSKGGGLGLAGMQTRAEGCGGTLSVKSSADKGVEIEVTCPTKP